MLNTLNFKHIYYFWMVATEGSIARAADKTNVSPSSISEQIKILEGRIGVDLFERTGKSLKLTHYGERVFNEIDPFFFSTEEIFESIVNHKKTNVRFLRIGVSPGIPEDVRYEMTFPFVKDINYTVRLIQGENSYLKHAYENNEVDMILSLNKGLIPKSQSLQFKIRKESHAFVCSNQFYKKMKKTRYPEGLNQERFINYTNDSELHFLIHKYFNSRDITPLRVAEIDDINIVKKLVRESIGFALLPVSSITKELNKGTLKNLLQVRDFDLPLTFYYKKSFKEDRFIKHLENLK